MYEITITNKETGRELTRDYDLDRKQKSDEELGEIMREMISRVDDIQLPF